MGEKEEYITKHIGCDKLDYYNPKYRMDDHSHHQNQS